MERPRTIVLALSLLWLNVAIGVVGLLFLSFPDSDTHGVSLSALYAFSIGSLAIVAGLIYLAGTGRSWARVLVTLMLVLQYSDIAMQQQVIESFKGDTLREINYFGSTAIILVAIIAWFLPSANNWFRAMATARRAP